MNRHDCCTLIILGGGLDGTSLCRFSLKCLIVEIVHFPLQDVVFGEIYLQIYEFRLVEAFFHPFHPPINWSMQFDVTDDITDNALDYANETFT